MGVLKLLVRVFQSASNLKMCCWIAIKLRKNILHHIFYSIPTVLDLDFFLQNLGVLKLLVRVFQSASNLEMCCWIAIKLRKNILHHIFYSIPTISVKIVICNSQLTHFSTGVDFETTIYRSKFLVQ